MKDFKAGILKILRASGSKAVPIKVVEKKMAVKRSEVRHMNDAIYYLNKKGVIKAEGCLLTLVREKKKKVKTYPAVIHRLAGTFGFAKLENEEQTEIFIPGKYLLGAMPGDRVSLTLNTAQEGLDDGKVVEILEAGTAPILGTVQKENGSYYLSADKGFRNPIYLGKKLEGAEEGDRVLGAISRRGRSHDDHKITVERSFGTGEKASNCVEAILENNHIPREFPEEVLAQGQAIHDGGIHPKEIAMRVDRREEKIFTIDSAYSKDMDDAVSVKKTDKGYRLGVYIADVSYYVTPDSPLDEEALNRGTSIYYADKVIPMLPQVLSNDLCSLNPHVDRLTLSAIMEISTAGELLSYNFERSIINSKVKGVYSEINEILADSATPEIMEKYAELLPDIHLLEELATILTKNRKSKGDLSLSSIESRVALNEEGEAVEIAMRRTGKSESIIEECMLMANRAAAEFALKKELPFIYRTHEKPSPTKIENLCAVLSSVGISTSGIEVGVSQSRLGRALKEAESTPYLQVVNDSILRSMSKAKYTPENIGHYGLNFPDYAHFTSPIRRYPDLAIHRIISATLIGMRKENIEKRFRAFVGNAAKSSTEAEIRAMTVERESENCYKAEYMAKFLGEEMEGIVSGITNHGIYVQLPNTVEGLMGARELGETFTYDGHLRYLSIADQTQFITIGTPCKVVLSKVSIPQGQINFSLKEVQY